MFPLVKHINHI